MNDLPSLYEDPAALNLLLALWNPFGPHAYQHSFLHTRHTDSTPQKVLQDGLDEHVVSVVCALEDGQEIRIVVDGEGEDDPPILRYQQLDKGGAWRPNLLLSPSLSCAS